MASAAVQSSRKNNHHHHHHHHTTNTNNPDGTKQASNNSKSVGKKSAASATATATATPTPTTTTTNQPNNNNNSNSTPTKNQNQSWTAVVKNRSPEDQKHASNQTNSKHHKTNGTPSTSNNATTNQKEKEKDGHSRSKDKDHNTKDPDKDNNRSTSESGNGGKKAGSKVSHVICKFFKAGNCSAGTLCQFSHTLPEVGQGKPVCQWFVKGNCRFAHKCALAHILPGQPISMDRKNKRAAQVAARESAAASAAAQADPNLEPDSPPELVLEPASKAEEDHEEEEQQQPISVNDVAVTLKEDDDPNLERFNYEINPLSDSPRLSRQILKSPRSPLATDIDLELTNHSDDFQFGLPDDFANLSNGHLQIQPIGYPPQSQLQQHQLQQQNHLQHSQQSFNQITTPNKYLSAPLSPSALHAYLDQHQRNSGLRPSTPQAKPPSSDISQHLPISIERARAWSREHSPGPFGFGSPFSAPGSRSVFLPRLGSYGSEDGFPRSAPSVNASPRQMSFLNHHPANPLADEDAWDNMGGGREEDVTELLPSSLHSLLTPEERHRQRLRKLTNNDFFSRSVPNDNLTETALKNQHEVKSSSFNNHQPGFPETLSVSVSPAPALSSSISNGVFNSYSRQRDSSESMLRPQPTTYMSSSYIQPTTHLGTREVFQTHSHQGHPQALSPMYDSPSPQKDFGGGLGGGLLFGHAPGTSLPQGLAAGLSRLHFQPPLPTGLTPCGSPPGHSRDRPLSPPKSPPHVGGLSKGCFPSALSQRMAGLNFGSTTAAGHSRGMLMINNSSPLSRHVSYSPGSPSSPTPEEDDTPFKLEI